jgi:hypothetical protein
MSVFKLSSKDIAYTATFATLSVIVCKVIPGIPIIGGSGSIKFDAALAPIYGLIIGPYLGAFAALIGGLVSAGGYLSILTSFCTGISAFVSGMLVREYLSVGKNHIGGWMAASGALGLLIAGWYITGVGKQIPFYPIIHILGFLIILAFRGRIAQSFRSESKFRLIFAVCLATYCGIVADHMLGNLIYIVNFPGFNWPPIFMSVLPISILERGVLTAIASIIGNSLIIALQSAGLFHK